MAQIVIYRLKNFSTIFQLDSLWIFEIIGKTVCRKERNPTKT